MCIFTRIISLGVRLAIKSSIAANLTPKDIRLAAIDDLTANLTPKDIILRC